MSGPRLMGAWFDGGGAGLDRGGAGLDGGGAGLDRGGSGLHDESARIRTISRVQRRPKQ